MNVINTLLHNGSELLRFPRSCEWKSTLSSAASSIVGSLRKLALGHSPTYLGATFWSCIQRLPTTTTIICCEKYDSNWWRMFSLTFVSFNFYRIPQGTLGEILPCCQGCNSCFATGIHFFSPCLDQGCDEVRSQVVIVEPKLSIGELVSK